MTQERVAHPDDSEPTAADAMSSPGPQIGDDITVDVALAVLVAAGVRHLRVHNEDGRYAGSVNRDQLTAHRSGAWYTERTRLRDIVRDPGPFTSPTTPLRDADGAIDTLRHSSTPVVDDDGFLVGVLRLAR